MRRETRVGRDGHDKRWFWSAGMATGTSGIRGSRRHACRKREPMPVLSMGQRGRKLRQRKTAKNWPRAVRAGRSRGRRSQIFRQPKSYASLFSQAEGGTGCVEETLTANSPYLTMPNPWATSAAGAPAARQRGYASNGCLSQGSA